jgi:catechol 2,3-dioxygenase-like lactoylglutathione lyase family enzyme
LFRDPLGISTITSTSTDATPSVGSIITGGGNCGPGGGRRQAGTPARRRGASGLPATPSPDAAGRYGDPVTITGVQVLSLPVSDQDRARDFYVDVLGFELLRDAQMQPGLRWVQVAPRGAATSVTLVTWFETMPAGSNRGLVLETDDLEGDVERLRARGLEFPDGIQQQPWGRFVTFADPDGNGLVLQATSARRPTTGAAG